MWFKNLTIYKLTKPLQIGVPDFDDLLAEGRFKPCEKTQLLSVGWWMPLGKRSERFTHDSGSCFMICRRKETKIIPTTAINLRVEERVDSIEEREVRKVTRKERTEIKEEVIIDMLPNALIDTKLTYAYFDTKNNYLVVNSASKNECEALIVHLRQMLGSLPIVPLQVNSIIEFTMTAWLKAQQLPKSLSFGSSCKLESRLSKDNKASFTAHNLMGG